MYVNFLDSNIRKAKERLHQSNFSYIYTGCILVQHILHLQRQTYVAACLSILSEDMHAKTCAIDLRSLRNTLYG